MIGMLALKGIPNEFHMKQGIRVFLTNLMTHKRKSISDSVESVDISDLVDTTTIISIEQLSKDVISQRRGYYFAKRCLDVVASIFALIFFSLPMALVAIAIRLEGPGPIFYTQERLGLNGERFHLIKFRSMKINAETGGAQWAKENDPRVTRVGRFIRSCRLDELPQFWQVLTGEMSLIGPRPEREIFYQAFEKYIPGFSQRLLVKPGITGLAQVNGGYNLKPAEKILHDIEYIKTQSFWLDFKIIFMTVLVVLRGKNGGGR